MTAVIYSSSCCYKREKWRIVLVTRCIIKVVHNHAMALCGKPESLLLKCSLFLSLNASIPFISHKRATI